MNLTFQILGFIAFGFTVYARCKLRNKEADTFEYMLVAESIFFICNVYFMVWFGIAISGFLLIDNCLSLKKWGS